MFIFYPLLLNLYPRLSQQDDSFLKILSLLFNISGKFSSAKDVKFHLQTLFRYEECNKIQRGGKILKCRIMNILRTGVSTKSCK